MYTVDILHEHGVTHLNDGGDIPDPEHDGNQGEYSQRYNIKPAASQRCGLVAVLYDPETCSRDTSNKVGGPRLLKFFSYMLLSPDMRTYDQWFRVRPDIAIKWHGEMLERPTFDAHATQLARQCDRFRHRDGSDKPEHVRYEGTPGEATYSHSPVCPGKQQSGVGSARPFLRSVCP